MSYKVEQRDDEYVILENEKLVINTYKSRKRANEVCRGLNLGKGFGGTTPKFFTQSVAYFLTEETEKST